jgi:hypothetical protein
MKLGQHTENRPHGRPRRPQAQKLLLSEAIWVGIFCHLRDGLSERTVVTHGTSGTFIRAREDRDKMFVTTADETREQGGREKLILILPGEAPRTVRQPKFINTPDEMQRWLSKARNIEEKFERVTMGDEARIMKAPAVPAERQLWEALKRARTAAQVRRICSRSKVWLKSRLEFPSGSFIDWSWSPYPRALYEHAAEFCRAKLDNRYPGRDQRESGDYRRIEYLARVMAGLSLAKPISSSYSIEVFRKMKHPRQCKCWRCTLKIAPRYQRSLARFLSTQASRPKSPSDPSFR